MTDPPPSSNERLNTIIVIGLLITMIACLTLYGVVYGMSKASDGQILQLVGTISGGLVGFIARGVQAHPGDPGVTATTTTGDVSVNQPAGDGSEVKP